MSLEEYEDFVFTAGKLNHPDPAAEWRKASERQQRLADFLNGKKDYHVVAANGTDVRMNLSGMTWINCDGHENFPDGEVFSGPVNTSPSGKFLSPSQLIQVLSATLMRTSVPLAATTW